MLCGPHERVSTIQDVLKERLEVSPSLADSLENLSYKMHLRPEFRQATENMAEDVFFMRGYLGHWERCVADIEEVTRT